MEKKSGDEFLCLEDGAVGFVFKLLSGTQELETLVSRPDNLGSYDHGSYGGRENQLTQVVPWPPQTHK